MIGDIDPIKAARGGLALGDELTMHYGLVPRANRGIFAINELPDLAGRIQVGLFNILQEGDVQIKGFPVRLPLDILLVFSANPEDYTARGKIITPLKDRIGSEIRTHYPVHARGRRGDHRAGSLDGPARRRRAHHRGAALHPGDRRGSGVPGAQGTQGRQALGREPAAADHGARVRRLQCRAAGRAQRRGPGSPARVGHPRGTAGHHRQARARVRRRAQGRRQGRRGHHSRRRRPDLRCTPRRRRTCGR